MFIDSNGIIINTCGWIENLGYEYILKIIKSFRPNYIIAMGKNIQPFSEQLREDINSDTPITVLPSSDFIFVRNKTIRQSSRNKKLRDYFWMPTGKVITEKLNPNEVNLFQTSKNL